MDPWITLLLIVVVSLLVLYFVAKMGLDAELQRIIQIGVCGLVVIVLIWKYLLPALGIS